MSVFPNESRSTTSVQTTSLLGLSYQPPELSDNQYRMLVRSLNSEQREAHRVVLQWSRAKMKALTSKTPNIFDVDPILTIIFLLLVVLVLEKVILLMQFTKQQLKHSDMDLKIQINHQFFC